MIGYDAFATRMMAMMQAAAAAQPKLAEMRALLRHQLPQPADPHTRQHERDLPVGVLVSLVSAALLRNPRFMPIRSA